MKLIRNLLLVKFILTIPAYSCNAQQIGKSFDELLDGAFKEEMYQNFDWQSFSRSRLANQTLMPEELDHSLLNAAIFYATNQARDKRGRTILQFDPSLRTASQWHCVSMVRYDFFSHTNKRSAKYRTADDRIKAFGFEDPKATAENLAKGFIRKNRTTYEPITYWELANQIVDQLLSSKGHRDNILSNKYTFLGCGGYFYRESEPSFHYFTAAQNFGAKWED